MLEDDKGITGGFGTALLGSEEREGNLPAVLNKTDSLPAHSQRELVEMKKKKYWTSLV